MKKVIFLSLFSFATIIVTLFGYTSALAIADSNDKKSVFVILFDSTGGTQDDSEFVRDLFTSNFTNLGFAKIVDKASTDKMKKEMYFKNEDSSDMDKASELAKRLKASYIAFCNLTERGSSFVFTSSILDVKNKKIIGWYSEKVDKIEAFFDKMPFFCDTLVSKAGGATSFISKEQEKKPNGIPYGQYKIGDTGPGGGIVVYTSKEPFKVYDSTGDYEIYHYFEASNTLGWSYWFPNRIDIEGTKSDLGYGKANTYKILHNSMSGRLNDENCAAYRCNMHSTPSTKARDWWLPSTDELKLICIAQKDNVFRESTYKWLWSSTEEDIGYAWGKDLDEGEITTRFKDDDDSRGSVWAIRAF